MLVHFVSILFCFLTLSSLLKSDVTDYKTYYRLKVGIHLCSFMVFAAFLFVYKYQQLISCWVPFFGTEFWWVYVVCDIGLGGGYVFFYGQLCFKYPTLTQG